MPRAKNAIRYQQCIDGDLRSFSYLNHLTSPRVLYLEQATVACSIHSSFRAPVSCLKIKPARIARARSILSCRVVIAPLIPGDVVTIPKTHILLRTRADIAHAWRGEQAEQEGTATAYRRPH